METKTAIAPAPQATNFDQMHADIQSHLNANRDGSQRDPNQVQVITSPEIHDTQLISAVEGHLAAHREDLQPHQLNAAPTNEHTPLQLGNAHTEVSDQDKAFHEVIGGAVTHALDSATEVAMRAKRITLGDKVITEPSNNYREALWNRHEAKQALQGGDN